MDLGKAWSRLRLVVGVLIFVGATQVSSESQRLSFAEKLQVEESQRRKEFADKVAKMSDAEYKGELLKRISTTWSKSLMLEAVAIVDVSSETNQRILSKSLSPDTSIGVTKLKSILELAAEKISQTVVAKQEAVEGIMPRAKNLVSQDTFSSPNKTRHFETVKLTLNQPAAIELIKNTALSDLSVVEADSGTNSFLAINTVKGSVIPAPAQPKYTSEFLKDGFYQELKESFAETRRTAISISVAHQEYLEQDTHQVRAAKAAVEKQILEAVLSDSDLTVCVELNRRNSSATFYCPEETIDHFYHDERVRGVVSDASFRGGVISLADKEMYYKELKDFFQIPRRIKIVVHLVGENADIGWSESENLRSKELVQEVISQLNIDDYSIDYIGYYFFTILANENVLEPLYLDRRVKHLNDGDLASSRTQISNRE